MKLKEIHRTSTFAWSPAAASPLLATGTVAGALDESFSNESSLEIWAPDFLDKDEFSLGVRGGQGKGPRAVVKDSARFNRLAWGYTNGSLPQGVIAAGLENGELALWDPAKILAGDDDALILRNTTHTGPVRGLDFNPVQSNLLASGGTAGEVYIWDLKDPSKPYTPTPGSRSTKLDEITSIAWNRQVQYVLAGASNTGYTVVWDLRGKREVVALAYGQGPPGSTMGGGGRRGMSAIAWHPDSPTRVVTASEDDSSPVIMVWDLRNARAPEKILTGHEKGILSLSWCNQDADLLLSCGKDNRALCWNPQTSELIGELPIADNWAFQVDWNPRNPDILATAFFSGTIGIYSIQSANAKEYEAAIEAETAAKFQQTQESLKPDGDGADIFDNVILGPEERAIPTPSFSLQQTPKWLKRPASVAFGFGGQLVSVSNLPGAAGKNQSSVVHIRKVVTEETFVQRAKKLRQAVSEGDDGVKAFAEAKAAGGEGEEEEDADEGEAWKALLSLFNSNSREELVTLLGFSKDEIAKKVAEAVAALKLSTSPAATPAAEADEANDDEETEEEKESVSASSTEEGASSAGAQDELESTTTAPSLFGEDDLANGGAAQGAGNDFFSALASGTASTFEVDSSVAATAGDESNTSTAGDETAPSRTAAAKGFKIYPANQTPTDQLVTQALVLGDFKSAVELCFAAGRFADAILFAVRGGQELLAETQERYFKAQLAILDKAEVAEGEVRAPYLRLLKSVVEGDLEGIVRGAGVEEWREVFVVVCTYASKDAFGSLVELLGERLEKEAAAAAAAAGDDDEEEDEKAQSYRKHATLTYLAAARLEKLVKIWVEEMEEEEVFASLPDDEEDDTGDVVASKVFAVHATALQTFLEKVTIFRSAVKYVDEELPIKKAEGYKLAGLYDRYLEYAEVLATQGLLGEAAEVLKLVPTGYGERDRLAVATGAKPLPAAAPVASNVGASTSTAGYGGAARAPSTTAGNYGGYAGSGVGASGRVYPQQPQGGYPRGGPTGGGYQPAPVHPTGPTYAPPAPTNPAYAPPAPTNPGYAPPAPTNPAYAPPPATNSTYAPPSNANAPYNPPNPGYVLTPSGYTLTGNQAPTGPAPVPPPPTRGQVPVPAPPPPRANGTPGPTRPGSTAGGQPAIKRDPGGWNDAPNLPITGLNKPAGLNLSSSASQESNKPAPITAPFPNSPAPGFGSPAPIPPSPYAGAFGPQQGSYPGQPPRPGSVGGLPPPPRPGSVNAHVPPPPKGASVIRPASRGAGVLPPPPHVGAHGVPSSLGGPQRQPTPSQYAPPPPAVVAAVVGRQSSQSYAPPPQQQGGYAPPPGQHPQGGYAPPPGQHPQGGYAPAQQQGGYAPPPQHQGNYGPPPGQQGFAPPPQQGGPGNYGPPPPQSAGAPPPPAGAAPPGGPAKAPAPPAKQGPPPPKYPPGDRSHIPEDVKPAYEIISENLDRMKQTTPPAQKRMVDDVERRVNMLFDALNCETLSAPIVEQLLELTRAMAARDRQSALSIHVDLLTRGSQKEDIGLWMSALKQLIMRL